MYNQSAFKLFIMHAQLKSFLIILFISVEYSCNKNELCTTYPCNKNSMSVKNFADFNYRKGTWVNITHINERATLPDTLEFITDSTWSIWNEGKYIPPYYSQINQKKYVITSYDGKSGQLRNYANFLDSPTKDFRTYIWYYDSLQGYVYIDFNKDFRFSSQKIVYSRFVKIK